MLSFPGVRAPRFLPRSKRRDRQGRRERTAAIKVLVADEDYVNLLRAEKLDTMPKFLADRVKEAA